FADVLHADDDAGDLGQHPLPQPADAGGDLPHGRAVALAGGQVRGHDGRGGGAVVGHDAPSQPSFPNSVWERRSCETPFRGRSSRRNGVSKTDRKSTRLNSSHVSISYAVFCLKKK